MRRRRNPAGWSGSRALLGAALGVALAKMIGDALQVPMVAAAQASCATGDQAACAAVPVLSQPADYLSPATVVGGAIGAWLLGRR